MLNCECWYSLMHVLRLWTILELSAVSNNQSNTMWLCDGSLQHWWKFNTCSIVSNAYLFYVSFAGLGLGVGLVTAGLDYNTAEPSSLPAPRQHHWHRSVINVAPLFISISQLIQGRNQKFIKGGVFSHILPSFSFFPFPLPPFSVPLFLLLRSGPSNSAKGSLGALLAFTIVGRGERHLQPSDMLTGLWIHKNELAAGVPPQTANHRRSQGVH